MSRTAVALLLILFPWLPAQARAVKTEILRATMQCGDAQFRSITRDLTVFDALDDAKIEQTITVLAPGDSHFSIVDAREPSFALRRVLPGTRLLGSFINAWQCRQTPAGHVLVLLYRCQSDVPEEPPRGSCASSGEWTRYISLRGKPLDKGFSFDDRATRHFVQR